MPIRPRNCRLLLSIAIQLALACSLADAASALPSTCLHTTDSDNGPRALTVADFDRDGRPDVVALAGSGRAVLHRGRGDGSFGPPTVVATGTDLRDLLAFDFDEDGATDLAIVDRVANGLRILRGRGDGTFDPPSTQAAGTAPVSIASGDLNADGIADLGVLNDDNGRVQLFRGRGSGGVGDGTFELYSFMGLTRVGSSNPRLRILDVDGDGILDLTANISMVGAYHQIAISYGAGSGGTGNGYFGGTTYFNTAVSPSDFLIADVDQDGRKDIVLSYTGLKYVEFHSGLGSRTFGAYHLVVTDLFPGRLAVADLDGNGRSDVFFSGADRTVILPIDGTGSTWGERIGPLRARVSIPGAGPLHPESVNGDATVDVVTCDPTGTLLAVQTGECLPQLDALDMSPSGLWGSEGRALVTGPGGREGVSVASDGAGGAFLTWRDRRAVPEGEVHATRIGPDGSPVAPWPAQGRTLRPPAGGSPSAAPVADGQGGLHVVIGETGGVYAHHLAADGSPAPGWPVEGLKLDDPAFAPLFFLADGAGGLIVVGRFFPGNNLQEIRVRRYASTATTAPGWPGPGVVVASNSLDASLSLTSSAADGQGGVYVAWDTYVPATGGHGGGQGYWGDSFAYVRDGQVAWGANSAPAYGSPFVLSDDRGGAFGFYSQNGTEAVCTLWTPAGAAWASLPPFDMFALYDAAGDGARGALYVARHYSGEFRIYRTASSGATAPGAWTPEGLPLYTDETPNGMEPDLRGGALLLSTRSEADGGKGIYARYFSNLGTAAPGWSSTGHRIRLTSSAPGRVVSLLDGQGGMLLFWDDPNGGSPAIYGQRLGPDHPVPVAVSFIDFTVESDLVRLRWFIAIEALGEALVERRMAGQEDAWTVTGSALADATGRMYVHEDRSVPAGCSVEYRLTVRTAEGTTVSGVQRVDVPPRRFALGLEPMRQPARRGDPLRLTVRDRSPGRIDVFDVRGRRVWSEALPVLEPGERDYALPPAAMPGTGIYWLRFRQAQETVGARIVLLD